MTSGQLRAKALSEWRGLPETPFPRHNARALGEMVGGVMEAFGLRDRLCEEQVVGAWGEIVGEFVARHSAPQKLTAGVLTVRVLQPTLRFELDRVWKPKILAKFQARFGAKTVREVRFLIG